MNPTKYSDHLLDRILKRRKWAVHRHVHLCAAFEECARNGGLASFISIGCGSGLTELYLANRHPEVQFTLTDFDESRLAVVRKAAAAGSLKNVQLDRLDLLNPGDAGHYDMVASIEVLEHIYDDKTAATNYRSLSSHYVYTLVPYCTEEDLTDAKEVRRAWVRLCHYRPGYTERTLTDLFGQPSRWMRPCYLPPGAQDLRTYLGTLSDEEIVDQRDQLLARAADDLNHAFPAGSPQGIEILTEV